MGLENVCEAKKASYVLGGPEGIFNSQNVRVRFKCIAYPTYLCQLGPNLGPKSGTCISPALYPIPERSYKPYGSGLLMSG